MKQFRQEVQHLAHELTNYGIMEAVARPVLAGPVASGEVAGLFFRLLSHLVILEDGEWKAETDLRADLGMDSLDLVELVMNCEQHCRITLTDAEWVRLRTIGQWVSTLEKKVGQPSPPANG